MAVSYAAQAVVSTFLSKYQGRGRDYFREHVTPDMRFLFPKVCRRIENNVSDYNDRRAFWKAEQSALCVRFLFEFVLRETVAGRCAALFAVMDFENLDEFIFTMTQKSSPQLIQVRFD